MNCFFNHGLRINPDLIADLSCSRIPQVIGSAGDKPQTEMFDWYFHPVIVPTSDHPIVSNIGPVNLDFPSPIDTLPLRTVVERTVLLQSSDLSRVQKSPVQLGFDILQLEPDPSRFRSGPQITGVIQEGQMTSAFKNRLTNDFQSLLNNAGVSFQAETDNGRFVLISDGDLIKNFYNSRTKSFSPVGFNRWEKYVFEGNQKLILNTIDYLLDDVGLLKSRSKEVKLRLLNMPKIDEEKVKWQLINMIGPLLILLIFGIIYFSIRKYKYKGS